MPGSKVSPLPGSESRQNLKLTQEQRKGLTIRVKETKRKVINEDITKAMNANIERLENKGVNTDSLRQIMEDKGFKPLPKASQTSVSRSSVVLNPLNNVGIVPRSQSPPILSRVPEESRTQISQEVKEVQGSPLGAKKKSSSIAFPEYNVSGTPTHQSKTPKIETLDLFKNAIAMKVGYKKRFEPNVVLASYLPKIIILHYIHYKCDMFKKITTALSNVFESLNIASIFKESVLKKIKEFSSKLEEDLYIYKSIQGNDIRSDDFMAYIEEILSGTDGIEKDTRKIIRQFTTSYTPLINIIKNISMNEIIKKVIVQEEKTRLLFKSIYSIFKKHIRDSSDLYNIIHAYVSGAIYYLKFLDKNINHFKKRKSGKKIVIYFRNMLISSYDKDVSEVECVHFLKQFLVDDIKKTIIIIKVISRFIDSLSNHILGDLNVNGEQNIIVRLSKIKNSGKIKAGCNDFKGVIDKINEDIPITNIKYKTLSLLNKRPDTISIMIQ
jgi:hypothetical protein